MALLTAVNFGIELGTSSPTDGRVTREVGQCSWRA